MRLGLSENGDPSIAMYDDRMAPKILIQSGGNGPSVMFGDASGRIRVMVRALEDRSDLVFLDANGTERVVLLSPTKGFAGVVVRDGNGDARVFAGMDEDGRASVETMEPGGACTIRIVSGPKGSEATFMDRSGAVLLSLPRGEVSASPVSAGESGHSFSVVSKPLRWSADLTVGVQLLDEQHIELFNRINTLEAALRGRASDVESDRMVSFLDEYVKKHFSSEEFFMKRYGYPAMQAHVLEHRDLTSSFESVKQRIKASGSSPMLGLEMNRKIGEWFVNHIRGTDRALGVYIAGQPGPQEHDA